MLGAIIGDIAGSKYEFSNIRTDRFDLLSKGCSFTDDTVCTIANMDWLLHGDKKDPLSATEYLRKWTRRYPYAGYGGRFYRWLAMEETKPYNSWGNGSAMRVSSVGWLFDSLERTREVARWSAEVTHNHPEGVKGAEATASVIWMARNGYFKTQIKDYIIKEFGYDLSRTCDQIRPNYHHVESCQETVPEAITAFLEGTDFEDVIRTAVSLGGDCDTLTDIATAMAEAFYGLSEKFRARAYEFTTEDMHLVMKSFEEKAIERKEREA